MSIYSTVESGTSFHRSRFSKSISYTKKFDCQFGQLIPVLEKFVLPGDIWRIGGDCLVRFQPQLAPSLTSCNFRVRYFFVPLRLLDSNAELIITGSKDGHLFSGSLPEFKNFVADADTVLRPDAYKVTKHSLWDYLGVQVGDYSAIKSENFLPAQYWSKAYYRILWDYYFDENLHLYRQNYSDFEEMFSQHFAKFAASADVQFVSLPKDYFTSSLPWQLKGIAPQIDVSGVGSFTPNFDANMFVHSSSPFFTDSMVSVPQSQDLPSHPSPFIITSDTQEYGAEDLNEAFNYQLNKKTQSVNINGFGFTADDLRTMMAQTRIFERLARTGSRYTEYLRANFGTSPADDTLQRAQYLGGWKLPIVTTEVLQTAADGSTPVGTMRGHGITRGGNQIQTFFAKEFGIILGIAHILPNIEYTSGCPKEFSYKSRFDFFNPSFQHLSEQEVKNGELFVNFTGGGSSDNDDTFGFQAYANELRSSVDKTVGDLRDSLSYWTQSIHFSSRPNLNSGFISSYTYRGNFNQNFAVSSSEAYPCIVQFRNNLDVYRPMVRYSTPGLVDHL